jgi:hypothetical protein
VHTLSALGIIALWQRNITIVSRSPSFTKNTFQNEAKMLNDTIFLPRMNAECGQKLFVDENSLDAGQQIIRTGIKWHLNEVKPRGRPCLACAGL